MFEDDNDEDVSWMMAPVCLQEGAGGPNQSSDVCLSDELQFQGQETLRAGRGKA